MGCVKMSFNGNTVGYEVCDRRAYITLNRPERLNAITCTMAREIDEAVTAANTDEQVRVIVLQTGHSSAGLTR